MERGGYRPLNESYPGADRGYVPDADETDLPRPPAGRSGEAPPPTGK